MFMLFKPHCPYIKCALIFLFKLFSFKHVPEMLIKCTLQCKNRKAVQKPYKQQPVAQVEEKSNKGLACKDWPSVTEPPSDQDPISSQHIIRFSFLVPVAYVNQQEGLLSL